MSPPPPNQTQSVKKEDEVLTQEQFANLQRDYWQKQKDKEKAELKNVYPTRQSILAENFKAPPVPPELVCLWIRQLQKQKKLGPNFLELRCICGKTIDQLLTEAETNAATLNA